MKKGWEEKKENHGNGCKHACLRAGTCRKQDGLNIYDYDISYKNNRLYFKTIKKSEYTPSMNNGRGWYFPLYFPVFR